MRLNQMICLHKTTNPDYKMCWKHKIKLVQYIEYTYIYRQMVKDFFTCLFVCVEMQ